MNEKPPRRRRQRRLSDAERTLWGEVTRGVAPLCPPAKPAPETEASPKPVAAAEPPQDRVPAPVAREPSHPPPLAPLGRRMRQRIARGSHAIGGRLDLHGLKQREAHAALLRFLRTAQTRGVTLVLVITGKGARGGESGGERGVLKRQVPLWLRLPAFHELVVGFEPAHVIHGGEGALYVRLRRTREIG
ncbi:MAG: DNA mismatch repair protein MutS [Rhizobiales bacterium]|nr:DNA mismatch repair protein MutS [Hyphomicrobiales bacterium]